MEKGATIVTDGWKGYNKVQRMEFKHMIDEKEYINKDKLLPHVHLIISLLKRWIMGTMQGSVSEQHMAYYLDEYTFRFNRRTSGSRGMLFYRLVEQAAGVDIVTYNDIISRREA